MERHMCGDFERNIIHFKINLSVSPSRHQPKLSRELLFRVAPSGFSWYLVERPNMTSIVTGGVVIGKRKRHALSEEYLFYICSKPQAT